ncbi:Glycosyl transferase family 2 [Actinomyces bovis]|uniref:Glycosyl transferase family 2 n=1 Tax=Actinomyces bovis TaxID=1658 RepID=A0ABY1VQS9_9ACTO|nr:glycosyltransferase [Actinomyces bovis]SPT53757.1 Glycosyl transferase family 2 [Actinomyces bovis]VEG53086.1 Glycosyl transferase family 2 [Actinomyces israelii]
MLAGCVTVAYSILHYLDSDVTIQCVEAIRDVNGEADYWIVVVDNGSKNGSCDSLRLKYADEHRVIIIETQENLGFAAGNNVGYRYAKEQLKANLILVMNNDVLVEPSVSAASLCDIVGSCPYALVGPRIADLSGRPQNPLRMTPLSNLGVVKAVFKNVCWLGASRIPLVGKWVLDKRDLRISRRQVIDHGAVTGKDYKDVVLHGACIIYTQLWIVNESVAFVPGTFMYAEEDILFDYARAAGYKTGMLSSLGVCHLEDRATRSARPNREERFRFTTKEQTRSLIRLLAFRVRGRWPV